jgi:UDP-N-acetylmuramate: L-alanyl-gamma-D-glutamyl-meso-diaminopimelate ligase
MRHEGSETWWTLLRAGERFAELRLPMAGEHNALNATAAAALAVGQGVPVEAIDFAHHPTAIRETLRALRTAYPDRRLWAVLEPRSNTLRRNVFEQALVESLALADRSVLAAVFKSEAIPEGERLHPENVVAALGARGLKSAVYADADAIIAAIAPELRAGDVVAILSNGGFGGIYTKLPQALEKLPQALGAAGQGRKSNGEIQRF